MTTAQPPTPAATGHAYIRLLGDALRRADPAAAVAEPHVVARVVKHALGSTNIFLRVPHDRCYWVARDVLADVTDADELHVDDIARLPETVILLSCPEPHDSARRPLPEALLALQRQLFHVKVHLAVQRRIDEGALTGAILRQRIHRIGQTEFDEVRFVLRREHLLLPPRDDATVYAEFAAMYLEISRFARHLLPRYFPTIWHSEGIEAVLADDVDVDGLLSACQVAGAAPRQSLAAEPVEARGPCAPGPPRSQPGPARRRRLAARAERAERAGNAARAAILYCRAGAAELSSASLGNLACRLSDLLQFAPEQRQRLHAALAPLLPWASRGYWPLEARLLYELQKACIDHERELFSVDPAQWLLALGRHPLKRPLPVKREVLIVRHLRGAIRKLAAARIDEASRQELLSILGPAVQQCEHRLRDRLRGVLAEAMTRVGLVPDSIPETVARDKIVEELLDGVMDRGFLTIGDLRDAMSRNNLKLPDLGGPLQRTRPGVGGWLRAFVAWFFAAAEGFYTGGELLQFNRVLASTMDGAYRAGEFYMRWLHRLSQLAFGTKLGRLLTRLVLVPFGGAFIILEGLLHLLHLAVKSLGPVEAALRSDVSLAALGLYLLALVNLHQAQAASRWLLRTAGRILRLTLIVAPRWLASRRVVHWFFHCRPYRLFQTWLLGPAAVTLAVTGYFRLRRADKDVLWAAGSLAFLFSMLLLNTRNGRRAQELAVTRLAHAWRFMRRNILWGTLELIIDVFRWALEMLERLLYSIDQWLRFRAGGSRLTLVAKAAVSVPWFIVSYVLRFVVNLLIEPQINPVKHFPVVTVSHKLLLPTIPSMGSLLGRTFGMSALGANAAATTIIGSIPGFFGFLVWELMGNWRLFQANHSRTLSPAAVGSHGESMVRLMRPGLHSGTLPKLYAKMRHAEASAASRKFRVLQRRAHHIQESVRQFAERELVRLLMLSRGWGGQELAVAEVRLGSNRIALELKAPGLGEESLWLAFEEQSGWLLAGVAQPSAGESPRQPGWLAAISDTQRRTLSAALAGFYKVAGVDMVREQIAASLGADGVPYDIAEDSLVVWPRAGATGDGDGFVYEVFYDLKEGRRLVPRRSDRTRAVGLPVLDAPSILFRHVPILWGDWLAIWYFDMVDAIWPEPLAGETRFLPPPRAVSPSPFGSGSGPVSA